MTTYIGLLAVRGGGGWASGANSATFSVARVGTSLRILASETGSDGAGSGWGLSVVGSAGFSTGLVASGTTGGLEDFAAVGFGSEGDRFSTAFGASKFIVGPDSAGVWRWGIPVVGLFGAGTTFGIEGCALVEPGVLTGMLSGFVAGGSGGLTEALSVFGSAAGFLSGEGAFPMG